jgi:hypothetical protein
MRAIAKCARRDANAIADKRHQSWNAQRQLPRWSPSDGFSKRAAGPAADRGSRFCLRLAKLKAMQIEVEARVHALHIGS